MAKFAYTIARIYLSPSSLLFTDNFQVLTVRGNVSVVSLCATLNTTLFQLMFFTEARAHYAKGVRSIQTRDAAELLVVDPSLLGELDAAILDSSDWDVRKPAAERRELDALVFDALGMTTGERDAVFGGVDEVVVKGPLLASQRRERQATTCRAR